MRTVEIKTEARFEDLLGAIEVAIFRNYATAKDFCPNDAHRIEICAAGIRKLLNDTIKAAMEG
jgi:hypothetical protein